MSENQEKLPLYIIEADIRAKELGITREEVLKNDRELFKQHMEENGSYDDCFDPAQVSRLLSGWNVRQEWVDDCLAHVAACEDCKITLSIAAKSIGADNKRSFDYVIGWIRGRAEYDGRRREMMILTERRDKLRRNLLASRLLLVGSISLGIATVFSGLPVVGWILAVIFAVAAAVKTRANALLFTPRISFWVFFYRS